MANSACTTWQSWGTQESRRLFQSVPPDDVNDCLILTDLLVILSPSTAKCERAFSTMNKKKKSAHTRVNQDTTLTTLMRVRPSECNLDNFYSASAIEHCMTVAKTERYIELYLL